MPTRIDDPHDAARAVEEQRIRLRGLGLPEHWATTGEIFADEYLRIFRDPVRFASGTLGTHLRVERAGGLIGGGIAVALCGDRHIFVRHHRYATNRVHLEYPRGFAESGETGERTAVRELREETGVDAPSATRIGTVYADTGLLNMPVEVYVATVAQAALDQRELDRDEGITDLVLLTAAEIRSAIIRGEIDDALTLAAFSLFVAHEPLAGGRIGP